MLATITFILPIIYIRIDSVEKKTKKKVFWIAYSAIYEGDGAGLMKYNYIILSKFIV